jgi:hypothetical protein
MANRLTRLLAELQETSEAHRKRISKSTRKCSHDPHTTNANLLLRRIRNLHVNINQERLRATQHQTLKRNPPMTNEPSIGTRPSGNTPQRKPTAPTTDDISVRIEDQRVDLDLLAATEIRLALSEYHGRLTRRVGDSTDMDESSKLAATLITVRLIHDRLER